jgi:AcrR family transcriptional regulator
VKIADADGLGAVSMRSVARELGTSAPALYRYVADKEDLLELMADVVFSAAAPKRTGKWRRDLSALAVRMRAVMLRHPWLAELTTFRATLGPNHLRWLEAIFAALDGHGLDMDSVVLHAGTVMAFVRGYVVDELADEAAFRRTGLTTDAWMQQQAKLAATIFGTDAYPTVVEVMREARHPHRADRKKRGFEAGLACVLDGVAAAMKR